MLARTHSSWTFSITATDSVAAVQDLRQPFAPLPTRLRRLAQRVAGAVLGRPAIMSPPRGGRCLHEEFGLLLPRDPLLGLLPELLRLERRAGVEDGPLSHKLRVLLGRS
ncbi:hypothetical protein RJ55_03698 [Drechmeria coniospora]|nr:hypothetical protein RJ55_03698 [Drechmeria coniospora]